MRGIAGFCLLTVMLIFVVCGQVCCREMGQVVEVRGDRVRIAFDVLVRPHAMMIILGEGESVAGMAVCSGPVKGYSGEHWGNIVTVTDPPALVVGARAYIDTANAMGIAQKRVAEVAAAPAKASPAPSRGIVDQDLRLYYYAADQPVGYGALGVGYERTIKVSKTLGVELDGGITGIGNVSSGNANSVNTDQLIKSLNGRVKLDFSPGFGIYSGYRWTTGRGDDSRWNDLTNELQGKTFVAPSAFDTQTVQAQGMEYGLTLRPLNKLSLSAGFIPQYRVDYGTIGVRSTPGYLGEMRFATKRGAVRLRGLTTDGYWFADLGITIK